jgi:mono/diheme cytochrome c family protein
MNQVSSIVVAAVGVAIFVLQNPADAQSDAAGQVSPEQIKIGEKHYALNCSPCHGTRMLEPPVQVDLRQFPKDERSRFLSTVTNGRRGMPPWRGALSPEDIEAIWAYVSAGEPN